MYHLDEIRPQYQNGEGKPKGKKQPTRAENIAALYAVHRANADTVASTPETRRMLAANNTLRTIQEVGFDGIPRALETHNYGGHSDNEVPRTYASDSEYFALDNKLLRRFYPDAIEAPNDVVYIDALLNGKEGRKYNSVNLNYRNNFLSLKTAKRMIQDAEAQYERQLITNTYIQPTPVAPADATYVAPPIIIRHK